MSDNWLQFVSTDPTWQPTAEAADRAVALLKSMSDDPDEVTAQFKDQVEFVDSGSNWSGVRCPSCDADLEDWWSGAVQKAWESSALTDLSVVTPCCETPASLNDLHYGWPAGFGRFVLEAMNPGFIPTEPQERELSACLGSPLRTVWMHL